MNIYGASGHGKVIIDIAKSQDITITGVLDDNLSIKYLSGYSVGHTITTEFLMGETVFAIGDNKVRENIANSFKGKIHAAIVHSSSVISSSATLGKGTVVMANAAINSDVVIGDHCIINTGSTVEHDCRLENFVHISPNAAIAGDVRIGTGTHIGIGAVVTPGIRIGERSTIGAGAVIIEDVPSGVVVVGNPGRIIKKKII